MKKSFVFGFLICLLSASSLFALTDLEESMVKDLEKKIGKEQKKIDGLTDKSWGKTPAQWLQQKKDTVTNAQTALNDLKAKIKGYEDSIAECDVIINRLEPKGNRTEADETMLKTAKKKKKDYQYELNLLASDYSGYGSQLTILEESLKGAQKDLEKEQEKYDGIMEEVAEHQKEIDNCEKEIASIKGEDKDEYGVTQAQQDYWKNYTEYWKKQQEAMNANNAASANLGQNTAGNGSSQPSADIAAADESEEAFSEKPQTTTTPTAPAAPATPSTGTAPSSGSSSPAAPAPEEDDAPAAVAGEVYEVVGGDSLSKIAKKLLGDAKRYPEIIALNKAKYPSLEKNPNLIYAGWKLVMPESAPAPETSQTTASNQPAAAADADTEKPASPAPTTSMSKTLRMELDEDPNCKQLKADISKAKKSLSDAEGMAGNATLVVENRKKIEAAEKALADYLLKTYNYAGKY
jgi:LysM repeat protein/archaellum component FlaC